MSRFSLFFSLVVFSLFISRTIYPQEKIIPYASWKEAGFPCIQNFSPKEYKENPQNWSIVQDERGIMYFGNTHGVLIYDGVSWQLIPIANKYVVRSLFVKNGLIYVGGQNEIGYLESDAIGKLQYISLTEAIPEEHRDFGDVRSILSMDVAIYFQADRHLFRWDGEQMKIWTTDNRFSVSPGGRTVCREKHI
jgi:hypothetical protein